MWGVWAPLQDQPGGLDFLSGALFLLLDVAWPCARPVQVRTQAWGLLWIGGAPATGLRAQTSQIGRESPQGRAVSVSLTPPKLPELQVASLDAAWPTDEPGGPD